MIELLAKAILGKIKKYKLKINSLNINFPDSLNNCNLCKLNIILHIKT